MEQLHRLVQKINNAIERKEYCSAVFLDNSQAFDKVWHKELLYKLNHVLSPDLYQVVKSYLNNRYFLVKVQGEPTTIYRINY